MYVELLSKVKLPLHCEYSFTVLLKHLKLYKSVNSTISNMLPLMQYKPKKTILISFFLFIIFKKVVSVGNKDVFKTLRMKCLVQVRAWFKRTRIRPSIILGNRITAVYFSTAVCVGITHCHDEKGHIKCTKGL